MVVESVRRGRDLCVRVGRSDRAVSCLLTLLCAAAFWKELAPSNPDWFYVRVGTLVLSLWCVRFDAIRPPMPASVARRIYMRNGVGVGWLSKAYSGAARRGCAPNRREFAARGTIRHAIQQLEKLKVVSKNKNGYARDVVADARNQLTSRAQGPRYFKERSSGSRSHCIAVEER
jgi:ribosomal protein S19E (S16A)